MKKYTVLAIEQAASDVALVTLQPKDNSDLLDFYPGQYATIGFRRNGRPTPMRCFSIVSSPHHPHALQFAMRVKGNFTNTVTELDAGDEAFVQGPFGSFVIDPDYDRNVLMLAAGIGITPFISMLRHATEAKLDIPVTLLYGVRDQDDIPFYEALLHLEKQNPRFKVVFFVSNGAVQPRSGVRFVAGKIDEARLEQATGGNFQGITYFICGPKGFMTGLQKTLEDRHVSPHRIVIESFTQAKKLSVSNMLSIPSLTYALTGMAVVLGFGFFMAIDLARAIPKLVHAQGLDQTSSTSSTSSSSGSTGPSSTSNSTSSNGSGSSDTSTYYNTPSQTQTQPTYNYSYQSPRSSLS